MMTGIIWFKLMSTIWHPIEKSFPGTKAILENNFTNVCDKNKVPLASIKTSLDL